MSREQQRRSNAMWCNCKSARPLLLMLSLSTGQMADAMAATVTYPVHGF